MNGAEILLIETFENETTTEISNESLLINTSYNIDNADYFLPFKAIESHNKDYIPNKSYRNILILGTKHVKETKHFLARSLLTLSKNGHLFIAADNKENGKRLDKWAKEINADFASFSGNKARCVKITNSTSLQKDILQAWKADGEIKKNADGFHTCPGLFSYDRIDIASKLLIKTLDEELKGHGSDLGCGYGYLSHSIAAKNKGIKTLKGFDQDIRALTCYQKNLVPYQNDLTINTEWSDLSQPLKHREKFDFIVMNPPFHDGRTETHNLGQSFIRNASQNLRKNGVLWMVANRHLPYEKELEESFFKVEKKSETNGFKVLRALR